MSMRDCPASGYVLEARKVVKALPEDLQEQANLLIEEMDTEGLLHLLIEHFPTNLPQPAEVFMLGDEDTPEELEVGELYVRWEDEDLYTIKEKTALHEFRSIIGTQPQFHHWAMWG